MVYILAALAFGLHIVIAFILVRKYLRTRDIGFVWLGVAVVVWPLLSKLLDGGERILVDRVLKHQPVVYPFTLVEHGNIKIGRLLTTLGAGQQFIGIVLLTIAVLYLYRANVRPAVSN
jgi:hypothetical protein